MRERTVPEFCYRVRTVDAEGTRALGRWLATVFRAGDVVVLVGDLGGGKTTLTQGIGEALGVSGRITSPTYIVSRVHRNPEGGPDLIHVDAYRVEDDLDMETIDLGTSLGESITVVEWGRGKVEDLSEDRFEVEFAFVEEEVVPLVDENGDLIEGEPREIMVRALGEEPAQRLETRVVHREKVLGEKRH